MQTGTNDLNFALMIMSRAGIQDSKGSLLYRCVCVALLFLLTTGLQAQGWEITFGGNNEDFGYGVIQTQDHGYMVVGFSESFGADNDMDVYVIRTDVDGTLLWMKEFDEGFRENAYDVIETEDNGFLIVGDIAPQVSDVPRVYLLKISKFGVFEWSKMYDNIVDGTARIQQGREIAKAAAGNGYAIVGLSKASDANENDEILLIRVDNQGNELWRNTYGSPNVDDSGNCIAALPDGGFVLAGNTKVSVGNDITIFRVDQNGNQQWNVVSGNSNQNEEINDLVISNDGSLIVVGSAQDYNRAYIGKYSLDGQLEWEKTFNPGPSGGALNAVANLADGNIAVCGYVETSASNIDVYIGKFDAGNGNEFWSQNLGDPEKLDIGEGLAASVDGGFLIVGYNSQSIVLINDVTLIKTDGLGNIITNHISGKVYHSPDGCNEFGAGDAPLTGWIIKAEGQNNTYFGTTDASGNYDILVDTGAYTITVLPPNTYWNVCEPAGFTVTLNDFYSNANFNFPVQTGVFCPYLEVAVNTDFLAVCDDVNYSIDYVNLGPVAAENAYVEVTLDSELSFVSATLPVFAQNGNTYTFLLGDVASTQQGSFDIQTVMDCEGIAQNQAVLVSAHIYPDSLCLQPGPNWDGSSVTVTGTCVGDSLRFNIRNIGLADMAASKRYFVVEDQVMFLIDTFQLDSDEELDISFEGTGATYRLIAEQSEDHPGNNNPTIAIEGCVEEGLPYSTGYVTQFAENDQDPFLATNASETTGPSNQPVELRGYPKGYQDSIIDVNTELKYTILFRNTTTDTITRVVIRDTLPAELDITTLTPGAGSHPYVFEIYNNGVLKITFDQIQLQPGDSAEEALKRGFVEFRIAQKPDNPIGTVIDNRAVVYFDYVPPMVTNQVRRVVECNDLFDPEESCIVVDVNNPPFIPGVEIKVYPNPFDESATFEINGREFNAVTLKLFDLQGRLVRSEKANGSRFQFDRNHLPRGLYMFMLESEGQLIATGKMIIQ